MVVKFLITMAVVSCFFIIAGFEFEASKKDKKDSFFTMEDSTKNFKILYIFADE